jgi:Zn-dependent membrane protease YugP
MMKAFEVGKLMLLENNVDLKIIPGGKVDNFYDIKYKFIVLSSKFFDGYNAESYLVACHEVAHAIQAKKYPLVMFLLKIPIINVFTNVILEFSASFIAIRWLRRKGLVDSNTNVDVLIGGFLSHLKKLAWIVFVSTLIILYYS